MTKIGVCSGKSVVFYRQQPHWRHKKKFSKRSREAQHLDAVHCKRALTWTCIVSLGFTTVTSTVHSFHWPLCVLCNLNSEATELMEISVVMIILEKLYSLRLISRSAVVVFLLPSHKNSENLFSKRKCFKNISLPPHIEIHVTLCQCAPDEM